MRTHRGPFDVQDRIHHGVAPRPVGHQLWLRRIPSSFAPSRSIAVRLAKLKKWVRNSTATQFNTSKAWPSISSLVSVLTPLRRADAPYQVFPISSRRFGASTLR